MRVTGRVKFFHEIKGYGFITPDDGSAEVFVHRTDLSSGQVWDTTLSGIILAPDQHVSYELADSKKGTGKKAARVELVK